MTFQINYFRIQVHGHLCQRWNQWFGGFDTTYIDGDVILAGTVPDQATIRCLLSKIEELGLDIIYVRYSSKKPLQIGTSES